MFRQVNGNPIDSLTIRQSESLTAYQLYIIDVYGQSDNLPVDNPTLDRLSVQYGSTVWSTFNLAQTEVGNPRESRFIVGVKNYFIKKGFGA